MTVLREDLLAGRAIVLAGGPGDHIRDALEALGARVEPMPSGIDLQDEERVGEWAAAHAPLHAVVYDASGGFAQGGLAGLSAALDGGWGAIREVVSGALLPAGAGGRVILVGPPPDAGALADSARAALENLVRTLSVEWARHEITAAMIAPGPATTQRDLAELVCFLVSPAGAYLSGCRLDLGAVGQ